MSTVDATTADAPPARRSHLARWAALLVGVPMVALVAVMGTRPSAASLVADSPLVGQPAPEVVAPTVDGETVRLAAYRGRWVVLNFFATWCIPCRNEHRDLVAFSERHRALGDAEVVAIVYDDTVEAVRAFRAERGGDWPMLVDAKGRIGVEFGVAGVPESFLIAPDGTVAAKVVGGVRDHDLEALLQRARADT